MPICDVCGKKVGFFDLYRLADGKCCPNCKGFALSHESTVSDIKQGLIKKENRKIIISRLESFFISEYEKLGLKFTRDGSDIKNAIKIDHIGSKYITFYNNTLYFIQGWNDYFPEYFDDKYSTSVNIAKTIEFKPLEIQKIPYTNIEYYYKDGDIQYTSEITGGGGGGSSITGALLGGLVAGGAGAIIGSRKAVTSIQTKVHTHNSTKTILVYKDGENRIAEEYEGHEIYNYLLTITPEKDLKAVQISISNNNSNENTFNRSIADEIRKFKELADDGIISLDEFEAKKKQLLNM